MVWNLILAHMIGDFLLQSDWMLRNKEKYWVFSLHAGIHLAAMIILVGQGGLKFWGLIVLIALIHFGQDILKIVVLRKRQNWNIPVYIVDQLLHGLIIWSFVSFFQMETASLGMTHRTPWVMIAISYLFVSYVWFITERILSGSNPDYLSELTKTKFSRMLARAGMTSAFFLIRGWASPGLGMVMADPYKNIQYRKRAIGTDVIISVSTLLFLYWALG